MAPTTAPNMGDTTEMSLLLLPAVNLWEAYRQTLEALLQQLKPVQGRNVPRLDIAVSLPSDHRWQAGRTALYAQLQTLCKDLYSLICICAAHTKVDLDFPGGIDARIFLLDTHSESSTSGKQYFSGPLVDLSTFVASKRPYKTIYSVEGESGEGIARTVVSMWRDKHRTAPDLHRLPCGTSMTSNTEDYGFSVDSSPVTNHTSAAVGGTFDHLHLGHKLLLTATVFVPQPSPNNGDTSRHITIGVTGDELLVNKKHASLVESWDDRQSRTAEFVESILVFHPDVPSTRHVEHLDNPGPNGKIVRISYTNPDSPPSAAAPVVVDYTRISDPFGPTITDEAITALVISHETRAGGKAVNDKRAEKGWHPLEVFEVEVLDADDGGDSNSNDKQEFESKISSTDIRRRLGDLVEKEGGGTGTIGKKTTNGGHKLA